MARRLQPSLHGCIVLLALVFSLLLQPTAAPAANDTIIRVGLLTVGKPSSITIKSTSPFDVRDTAGVPCIATTDTISLTASDGRITFTSKDPIRLAGPIRLVPSDGQAVFEIVTPKVRNSRYRGALEIRGGKALTIVNELPLEDYVRGVIPMEIARTFHPEAQKALTIAIRTYALTSLGRHRSDGYDVCDTTNCQGFAGASRDAEWVDKLIDQTRGHVITYEGELIHAVYSTDCGGITQNNEDGGFGSKPWPYLRSVVDGPNAERPTSNVQLPTAGGGIALDARAASSPPVTDHESRITQSDFCSRSPNHIWSKTYTKGDLERIFAAGYAKKIGKFRSMELTDYDCSGRLKSALVKGDKGECRLTGLQLRSLLGANVLKSTRVTMTTKDDGSCVFEGRGYGHGVGLCAWGADGLARSDDKITYVDILKHYYTGVEVQPIPESATDSHR